MGAFEQPIDGVNNFGGYPKGNGPECPNPKCKSNDITAVWRDAVWDETGCKCNKCGAIFVK